MSHCKLIGPNIEPLSSQFRPEFFYQELEIGYQNRTGVLHVRTRRVNISISRNFTTRRLKCSRTVTKYVAGKLNGQNEKITT